MCGVCGTFAADGQVDRSVAAAMHSRLVHRGPDETYSLNTPSVSVKLGRLGMTGLRDGWQPASDGGGRFVAMTNGEIYNASALKAELGTDRANGVDVAVIDTGINPEPTAFGARLQPGADLVRSGGDGLSDCDGHGTVVAGIIAAAPDHSTGFTGVAPGATIESIRQSSLDFGIRNAKQNAGANVAGTTTSLADAITFAAKSGARIINISSIAARQPFRGLTVYAASKAGLEAVTRHLAHELGGDGTTVNCVTPGAVESELLRETDKKIPGIIEQICANTPLQNRVGTPEEFADVVAWLCRAEAGWMTGQTISATGGQAMY